MRRPLSFKLDREAMKVLSTEVRCDGQEGQLFWDHISSVMLCGYDASKKEMF